MASNPIAMASGNSTKGKGNLAAVLLQLCFSFAAAAAAAVLVVGGVLGSWVESFCRKRS